MKLGWCLVFLVTLAWVRLGNCSMFGEYNEEFCQRNCPEIKPDKLNVHIVCHTHDDVGWLKTVDQYYTGVKNSVAVVSVQYILDSVIVQLQQDSSKKFIYVETAFFWRWWQEQDVTTRLLVRRLVREGQLEFIGGGWSMNDEGASHYNAIIDQMTWGFRRLQDIFGKCAIPKIGWQIDPFGHSREQASIFAQMGFDGLFLGRIDYQDKKLRLEKRQMEFVWNTSANLVDSSLFTGVLYNVYWPPPGFCFDILCTDDAIQDNPRLKDFNLDRKLEAFFSFVRIQSLHYKTNNILLTMGNDFHYQYAGSWYKNLDKLIKHTTRLENDTGINVFYSTPSCYLEALHKANMTWSVKSDDFFPYGSDAHSYWTGYFTSRPTLKGLIRRSNNLLQVCKQLETLAQLRPSEKVTRLRESLGVVQHHDAVTGTARQHVVNDYILRLHEGEVACQEIISEAYEKLMAISDIKPPPQVFCNLLNISTCVFTETAHQFTATIYNPLGHNLQYNARIPVSGSGYVILDPDGRSVEAQLVPVPSEVKSLRKNSNPAPFELVFEVNLAPLGFKTFYIRRTSASRVRDRQMSRIHTPDGDVVLSNQYVEVIIDGYSGLLKTVTDLHDHVVLPVTQNFYQYFGTSGYNYNSSNRASGAYVFRPEGNEAHKIEVGPVNLQVIQGKIVQEIHQVFNSWLSQVIRIYRNSNYVEFEWLVGPVPIGRPAGYYISTRTTLGREIISRFETNLKSEGVFYTDANGREIIARTRDFRPTWQVDVREPVSSNYYPVNSRIFLKDEDRGIQLTILTDRSVGGSSLQNGNLEIMLHRRLLYDDGLGMDEPLNEWGDNGRGLIARGITRLLVNKIKNSGRRHRELGQRIFLSPWVSFSDVDVTPAQWRGTYRTQFSGLRRPLPPNIHLLTLEQWTGSTYLIRLEHFYETADDSKNLSLPVTIDIQNLFSPFTIISSVETSLGANQKLKDIKRKKFEAETERKPSGQYWNFDDGDPFRITLTPMQIRSFIVEISDYN